VSGQFSFDNYKYILIDNESEITISAFGEESFNLIENCYFPIHLAFDDFNHEKTFRKQPACIEITEEDFKYLNKFEAAVAFAKIYLRPFGVIEFQIYDIIGGWNQPVHTHLSYPTVGGGISHNYNSSAKRLGLLLSSAVKSHNLSASNAYFNSAEIVATKFLKQDPSRGGQIEVKKVEYKNVLFQSKKELSKIHSIFVLSTESKNCNGTKSDGDGLAQIVSLKLMPHFRILERSNLDAVLDEQKLNLSGITEESTVLNIGKIHGSGGIIFCQESCISGQQMQTVKLLDCNTGEQEWIATGFGNNPIDLMNAIIQEIR